MNPLTEAGMSDSLAHQQETALRVAADICGELANVDPDMQIYVTSIATEHVAEVGMFLETSRDDRVIGALATVADMFGVAFTASEDRRVDVEGAMSRAGTLVVFHASPEDPAVCAEVVRLYGVQRTGAGAP